MLVRQILLTLFTCFTIFAYMAIMYNVHGRYSVSYYKQKIWEIWENDNFDKICLLSQLKNIKYYLFNSYKNIYFKDMMNLKQLFSYGFCSLFDIYNY